MIYTLDGKDKTIEFVNNMGCSLELSVEGYYEKIKNDPSAIDNMSSTFDIPDSSSSISVEKDYLLRMTRNAKNEIATRASRSEEYVLRMDLTVEGMHLVTSIPVDLTGIRSFPLYRIDQKPGKNSIVSLIVCVKAKAGGKILQGKNLFYLTYSII